MTVPAPNAGVGGQFGWMKQATRLGCVASLICIGCALIDPIDAIPPRNGTTDNPAGGMSAILGAGSTGVGGSGAAFAGLAGGVAETGGSPPQCTTNAACGSLSRCVPVPEDVSYCARLDTNACPTVLYGHESNNANAIFIGAFAPLYDNSVNAQSISRVYEMAAAEFNGVEELKGLRDRHGGPASPLVVIVCDNSSQSVPQALHHLIDEVQVPAVLAAMNAQQLLDGFKTYQSTFFISAFNGSRDLATASNGRLWTMLGPPGDYADIYEALMPSIVNLAHAALIGAGKDRDLRVAAVIENVPHQIELAHAVRPRLMFNGASVDDQPDKFLELTIASSGWNGDGVALKRLTDFQPDIVFSFAGDVFTAPNSGVVSQVNQKGWHGEHPIYVLSSENAVAGKDVAYELARLKDEQKDNAGRIFGIGPAGIIDGRTDALITFKSNIANYPPASAEFNNYYDAFYFLVDSIYASPRSSFFDGRISAADLKDSMLRLTNRDEQAFDMGPAGISSVFDILDEPGSELQLYGTMGPPDFNRETGMRRESGSVYCFDSVRFGIHPDTITYNRETRELKLTKYATCLQNFLVK